jgi:hypothetical protein
MTVRPVPRLATRFLKLFCSTPEHEFVIGDLTEQYQQGHGSIWYWRQVLNIASSEVYRRAMRRPLVRKHRIPTGQDFVLVPKEGSMKRHSGINTTHVTGEGLSGLPGLIITIFFIFLPLAIFLPRSFQYEYKNWILGVFFLVVIIAAALYIRSTRRDQEAAEKITKALHEINEPHDRP